MHKNWQSIAISIAYRYRKSISIVELFVLIYIDIYMEFLASNFSDLSRGTSKFARVGDNRRTVNTSTSP